MADWPDITDDDGSGLTGTIFKLTFFNSIRDYINNSGLDAEKAESPIVGQKYAATDTNKLYVCYSAGSWTEVGGAALPEQVRLPGPEAGDFATPSVHNKSSEMGAAPIESTTNSWSLSLHAGDQLRAAQKITLSGATIQQVSFRLAKNGSPTGTAYARVRKVSDDSIVETSATTLDVSTLTTDPAWCDFPFTCAPDEEVRVCIEYDGGDSNNELKYFVATSSEIPGWQQYYYEETWQSWGGTEDYDLNIKISFISFPATNTVDDDTGTCWQPDPPNEEGAWISWDIGSLKYVGGCRIYWGSEVAYRPTEYKIYTSPDASVWTEVIHETVAAPASAWKTYQWYIQKARYIKLVVTTHGASGTKICEADEYSTDSDGVLINHGHGGLS